MLSSVQTRIFAASWAFLLSLSLEAVSVSAQLLSGSEIRQILIDRVDVNRRSVGIVVGIVEPSGRRLVPYGRLSSEDSRSPDGDTLFEIASITKVFTSLLLAEMARRGEVALDDPVVRYLSAGTRVPERGRAITLRDLSTHVSGLPRFIEDFEPRDDKNPYAEITIDRMYSFLASHDLRREPGTRYEYSNLGGALLGEALALRSGGAYEAVLRRLVLDPLGLSSTRAALTTDLKKRLAPGHNEMLVLTPGWDLPVKGAGALHSSASDLLSFLEVVLGYRESPLSPAAADMLDATKRVGPVPRALGWQTITRSGREITWHNGSSGGYRSFVGLVKSEKVGVVVLSNAVNAIEDIGLRLLDPSWSLLRLRPPEERKSVDVSPEILKRYAGRYEYLSTVAHVIFTDGKLFIRFPWRKPAELLATSEKTFFTKDSWGDLTFVTMPNGNVLALQWRMPDQTISATRLD